MYKLALFIDAFITSEEKHNIFTNNIHKFSQYNWDIFVISNKIFSFDEFSQVKYFEYDCENRLLKDGNRYILPSCTHIWNKFYMGNAVYNFDGMFPSNGYTNWTILYNLKKICKILKQKGYTHLVRSEYDIDFKDYNIMSTIFKNFGKSEKSNIGMGVLGDGKTHSGLVASFFLMSVDYLNNVIPELDSEDDYENFMVKTYGSNTSPVFESLFYDLVKNDIEIMDQDETFSYINNPGLCGSDNGIFRHHSIRKSFVCCFLNDGFDLLLWNDFKEKSILVELKVDGIESTLILKPSSFNIRNCNYNDCVEVKTSDMDPKDVIRFDRCKKYNYASLTKIES
jgi:hypothetical protein